MAKATAPGQDECAIDWCRADCGCLLGFEKKILKIFEYFFIFNIL